MPELLTGHHDIQIATGSPEQPSGRVQHAALRLHNDGVPQFGSDSSVRTLCRLVPAALSLHAQQSA